jgi:hypothetical protein
VTAPVIEAVDGATADVALLRAVHLVETEADERGPSISERSAEEAIASSRHPGDAVRERGLARAAKLENLRRLRELRPDVERVVTRNAARNAAIVAANAALGFVPERTVTTAVLSPEAASAGRGLESAEKGR